MKSLTFEYRLYPQQDDFVHSQKRHAAFIGGIGSGKTYAGAVRALNESLRMPGLGMVVAPTYPMLRDSTLRTFRQVAGEALVDFNRSEMRGVMVTGSEIIFRSADDPDHLRGPNIGWAWIDEGAMCSGDVWLIVLGRLREGLGRAWVTSTPRGLNWVYETFVQNANDDSAIFRATTRANVFLPAEFLKTVETSYVGDFKRQELGGEFVTLGAGMFKLESLKVVDAAPSGLRWVRSWDLAASVKTTADYTVGARCAFADDGTLWIGDVRRGRWEWPDARRIILDTARSEPGTEIGVEKVAFQLAAIQELMREPSLVNTTIREIEIDRDKVSRAMPWAARAEADKVRLVAGEWNRAFRDEVAAFPEGTHDDQVDAVSGAVQMLSAPSWLLS